jgi:heat shock protein HslJ
VELKNNSVQTVAKEPHLILRSDENRIAGNGGCNSFFGSYALSTENRIVFSNIGSTKMACDNMLEESAFFQALGATRSYAKQGNELLLKDSLGVDLLKFQYVEGKN